jgi:hypothetical protein
MKFLCNQKSRSGMGLGVFSEKNIKTGLRKTLDGEQIRIVLDA